ncbi:MAG: hypothetical protein JSU08_15245 [Acidobacteria bacterium]|nr:hypothetical protein [Acidobacteriota bacterium]
MPSAITVVTTPLGDLDRFAESFLPRPFEHVVGRRNYRIFQRALANVPALDFRDPTDGELLIECRTFGSIDEARAWCRQQEVQ